MSGFLTDGQQSGRQGSAQESRASRTSQEQVRREHRADLGFNSCGLGMMEQEEEGEEEGD